MELFIFGCIVGFVSAVALIIWATSASHEEKLQEQNEICRIKKLANEFEEREQKLRQRENVIQQCDKIKERIEELFSADIIVGSYGQKTLGSGYNTELCMEYIATIQGYGTYHFIFRNNLDRFGIHKLFLKGRSSNNRKYNQRYPIHIQKVVTNSKPVRRLLLCWMTETEFWENMPSDKLQKLGICPVTTSLGQQKHKIDTILVDTL